jgi:hypothetical protein
MIASGRRSDGRNLEGMRLFSALLPRLWGPSPKPGRTAVSALKPARLVEGRVTGAVASLLASLARLWDGQDGGS